MAALAPIDVTRILASLSDGDRGAAEDLLPLIYDELRAVAGRLMQNERRDHTLQATALVHEAFVKLVAGEPRKWEDRRHFFRVAATVMRHILVNHARSKSRLKRGAGGRRVPLDEAVALFEARSTDLLALDAALDQLATIEKRKARVVELRFFAGLGVAETAEALDVSPRTVKNDWSFAKLWLLREMSA